MKKTIVCTKENPLHVQIKKHEKYKIEELKVSGFLGGGDFDMLTEMSQEKGLIHLKIFSFSVFSLKMSHYIHHFSLLLILYIYIYNSNNKNFSKKWKP